MTKTMIVLSNASTIAWQGAHAADLAGLINAGQDKTFTLVDMTTGNTTYIRVDAIISWYEVTTN